MCPAENLRAQAGWDGTVLQSRQRLLGELSSKLPWNNNKKWKRKEKERSTPFHRDNDPNFL